MLDALAGRNVTALILFSLCWVHGQHGRILSARFMRYHFDLQSFPPGNALPIRNTRLETYLVIFWFHFFFWFRLELMRAGIYAAESIYCFAFLCGVTGFLVGWP